jgi:hypothetical protein
MSHLPADAHRRLEATEPLALKSNEGLGPLVDSEEDPARLWAEIHTLRAALAESCEEHRAEIYDTTTGGGCMLLHDAVAAERERCAAWVDARRDAFCEEHGSVDPDTGTLEFGRGAHSEAKSEYVGELEEIAAGLRALGPNVRGNRPIGAAQE